MTHENDEVLISGISGRFPESSNLAVFWNHLYNGVDMVTDLKNRWDSQAFNIPCRQGQLKDLEKFDATFMGIHGKQVENMDPRMRFLLELTHEAVIDAGINPVTIRGSRTGVYVGAIAEETLETLKRNDDPSGYAASGALLGMIANRVSYAFDLQGPSMTIDAACSSSLVALSLALLAIRNAICDAAVVGGIQLCLDPKMTLVYTNMGMLSSGGKCASFDTTADGFVRSEAAVVLYVCKTRLARRGYATVVLAVAGVDGYKPEGFTFPSGNSQEKLLRQVYADAVVNPKDVDYIEAHGTATRAGDPQEVNAIARVFCEGRGPDNPLKIGAIKSNMGHAEPASGLCQIAKVILAHHHGILPGNLHYSNPNPDIPALADGRIKVVNKNTEFSGTFVGVNSFGLGGAIAHVLLKLTPKCVKMPWTPEIPVVVPFSGRTAEVESSLQKLLGGKAMDRHLVALTHEISRINIPGHNFRSYAIQHEGDTQIKLGEIEKEEERHLWFMFSGIGSQYTGMIRGMMSYRRFQESIARSVDTLKAYEYDLEQVLYSNDECVLELALNSLVALTAIQVALVDLFETLGITPDGIFGHSNGEVASAYADGCLTGEQTVLITLVRGRSFSFGIPGAMASVGLSWEEVGLRCPENVYPACNNGIDNVTISGPEDSVSKFVEELSVEGIFVKKVNSAGYAFHSKYAAGTEPYLREHLQKVIPLRTQRTPRWYSTSVPVEKKGSDLDKFCSVDYFVNNQLNQVHFYEVLLLVPQNAIVIEVAPHCLMQAILKRSLPNSTTYLGVMNRNAANNAEFFLHSMGQLYLNGCNPNFSALYDDPNLPATAETPMISPVIRWDHTENWPLPQSYNTNSGGSRVQINLAEDADSFYSGHDIDGRIIFPGTGYMLLIWSKFAKRLGKKFEQQPIIFENLRFEKSTILPTSGSVEFFMDILTDSGDFEVYEKDSLVFKGRIRELKKTEEMFSEEDEESSLGHGEDSLDAEDVHKELRLRGYEYSGVFRGIERFGINLQRAEMRWKNNWVGFLGTLIQMSILKQPQRGLYLPIRLQKLVIDPIKFLDSVTSNDLVPVKHLKNVKTVMAPGIEARGLKVSIAARRPLSTSPIFSRQLFVPYMTDVKDFTQQNWLEYFMEIVADNTPGPNFLCAEIENNMENSIISLIFPLVPPQFKNSSIFLISDNASDNNEQNHLPLISPKKSVFVKNANLVVLSKDSIQLADDLIAENGFILLRDADPQPDLPEYKLVAQKSGAKPVVPTTIEGIDGNRKYNDGQI